MEKTRAVPGRSVREDMRTITGTWSKIVADGTEQTGWNGKIRKGLKQTL